jgi:ribonuclease D
VIELPPLPVEIVDRPSQLEKAAREMLSNSSIALDTESNSFYHYPEQLCLVQIATGRRIYILDTIVLEEPDDLKKIIADASITKVIHGADYDIRSLDRRFGIRIHGLYDTYIAARFAGLERVGLAALTEDLLGVSISKSKRLQRADWGRRPISREALDYAASDVRYLFALKEVLDRRLQTLGRTKWAAEEFSRLEEVRYVQPDPETTWLSLKGLNSLDGRGLAVARSLYLFRESEARRLHHPPFFILPDATLVFLAASPSVPLSQVPGLGPAGLRRFGEGIIRAMEEGMHSPPLHKPRATIERSSHEQIRRLTRLKTWRNSLGTSMALDPSLLWPSASLERLARAPDALEADLASPDIRRWQRECFSQSLRDALKLA